MAGSVLAQNLLPEKKQTSFYPSFVIGGTLKKPVWHLF